MNIPVIVIFAPTATGKTALAIDLFGKSSPSFFKGKVELISADSMQVYRGMNIGTAKPDESEQNELTHHLIDIHNIDEPFSTAEFVQRAQTLCSEIYSRGHIPLIAGGTGFYIRNFILGLPETPESNPEIREKLKNRIASEGNEKLYAELLEADPESAAKIHPNDAYRIVRALEVFYSTGKPRSSFRQNQGLREGFDFKIFILERNREDLYERINFRVDKMFDSGLVKEVISLREKGARREDPGMQAIGYREFFEFDDLEIIREQIKHNSRKYAKKQYSYMNGIPCSKIIPMDSGENPEKLISEEIMEFFQNI